MNRLGPVSYSLLTLLACLAAAGELVAGAQEGEQAAVIIDRSVAVVGARVITAREVTRQLRMQAFYEREPVDDSPEARRAALDQLIERRLIQSEMRLASFGSDKRRAAAEMEALRRSNFGGGMKFEVALVHYGLRENDIEQFVSELVDVLRFIEFRFRTGLQITPEEVQEFYARSYRADMRRISETPEPLEKVQGALEERLAQQRVDSLLDQWLRELRASARVVFLPPDGQAKTITDPFVPIGPERQVVNP